MDNSLFIDLEYFIELGYYDNAFNTLNNYHLKYEDFYEQKNNYNKLNKGLLMKLFFCIIY